MAYRIANNTSLVIVKTHYEEGTEPDLIPLSIFVYWFDPSINRNRSARYDALVGNKVTKGLKLSGKVWPAVVESETETPEAATALIAKYQEKHQWCLDGEAYLSKIGALPPPE